MKATSLGEHSTIWAVSHVLFEEFSLNSILSPVLAWGSSGGSVSSEGYVTWRKKYLPGCNSSSISTNYLSLQLALSAHTLQQCKFFCKLSTKDTWRTKYLLRYISAPIRRIFLKHHSHHSLCKFKRVLDASVNNKRQLTWGTKYQHSCITASITEICCNSVLLNQKFHD